MSFRITGLPEAEFADLFALSDDALRARRAVRQSVDARLSFPCRISLTDAELGEKVILVNYEHQRADTPYRASHAIFVREGETTYDAVDEVPDQLRRRMLSLRAFDANGMIVGADLVDGRSLEASIATLLGDKRAAYLHAHFAKYGCYAARIERA
ncbi:MAG TPA: DUF1203 domain-containing protein [Stellaceae bacterium]|nr:DUF1203 domain-containing protein [Stellaceae bacterium]